MAYRITWRKQATNQLTELWLSGRDRHRINDAAEQLDRLFSQQPEDIGESRDGNDRIVFLEPLGCRFRVDSVDQIVYVEAVWRSK
jgi:hypothetical protein